jgi:hypothetical protein
MARLPRPIPDPPAKRPCTSTQMNSYTLLDLDRIFAAPDSVETAILRAHADKLERAFLSPNEAGEPLGILPAIGTPYIAAEGIRHHVFGPRVPAFVARLWVRLCTILFAEGLEAERR